MKKLNKFFFVSLASALIASSAICTFVNNSEPTSKEIILDGEVGTVIYGDGVIFKRVADDDFPKQTRESTEGFTVKLDGNTSLTKQINLTKTQGYWKVWIKNKGTKDIKYSTTGSQNSSVYSIPAGETWNVYATKKWSAGTYNANFTCGSGMTGQAACRTASTFDELDID